MGGYAPCDPHCCFSPVGCNLCWWAIVGFDCIRANTECTILWHLSKISARNFHLSNNDPLYCIIWHLYFYLIHFILAKFVVFSGELTFRWIKFLFCYAQFRSGFQCTVFLCYLYNLCMKSWLRWTLSWQIMTFDLLHLVVCLIMLMCFMLIED